MLRLLLYSRYHHRNFILIKGNVFHIKVLSSGHYESGWIMPIPPCAMGISSRSLSIGISILRAVA